MSGDLIGWIVGILAALLGAGGLYIKGRKDGSNKEQAKQDEINRKAEQDHAQKVANAKRVKDYVDTMSDADAERRLRERYTRD